MNFLIFRILFLSLATTAYQSLVMAQKLSPRRISIRTSLLQEGIKLIEDEYRSVLGAYEKVKAASPAEYGYYCNKLKAALIQAVEEEDLGFKSKLSQIGYTLFFPGEDKAHYRVDPINKFRTLILPKHLALLENNRSGLEPSELTRSAEKYITFLKDLRSMLL